MAIEQLSVKVGADVGGAVTGLATVEKSLSKAAESADKLNKSGAGVAPALDKIGSSGNAASAALERVYAKVEAIGDAAQQSKVKLVDLGNARIPLESINKYNAEILKLKLNLSSIKLTAVPANIVPKGAITDLDKIKGVSNRATAAFTDLSRVAQDVPYGFIGISNNLNPLLESFQRLSAEAKTAGVSVGSVLLKSLTGPGGLGLALGVVSAAMTIATVGMGAWTRGFGGAKETVNQHTKALQDAKKATQDYVDSLDSVSKARVVGAQNAQKELTELKTLYDATQNANIPLSNRKKLVDELQKQYPQYFGNIKDEIILAGNAKGAYDKLADSILKTGKVRAAQELIVEGQKTLLASDPQLVKTAEEQSKLLKQINALKKTGRAFTYEDNRGVIQTTDEQKKLNKLQEQYNQNNEEVNKILALRKTTVDDLNRLEKEANDTVKSNPDLLLDPGDKLKKSKEKPQFNFFDKFFDVKPKTATDKAKQAVEMYHTAMDFALANDKVFIGLDEILVAPTREAAIEAGKKFWAKYQAGLVNARPQKIALDRLDVEPPDLFFSKTAEVKSIFNGNKDFAKLIQDKFGERIIKPHVNIAPEVTIDGKGLVEGVEKTQNELSIAFNKLIGSGFESGFASFGESIGAAIAAGANPIEAAGKSIVGTIGDLIVQMGKAMIDYGVVKAGLDKLIQSGILVPGVAAIALGVAAVAVGTILKNAFKPKKFAQGGFVPGQGSGDTVPAMLTPGEYVVRKKDVPKFFSIIKLLEAGKFGSIKNITGALGFADGGFVPNVRSVSNLATNRNQRLKSFPTVVPQVVVLNQRLRGRDAVLQQARENKSQRRGG